jgi:hypothetical protein
VSQRQLWKPSIKVAIVNRDRDAMRAGALPGRIATEPSRLSPEPDRFISHRLFKASDPHKKRAAARGAGPQPHLWLHPVANCRRRARQLWLCPGALILRARVCSKRAPRPLDGNCTRTAGEGAVSPEPNVPAPPTVVMARGRKLSVRVRFPRRAVRCEPGSRAARRPSSCCARLHRSGKTDS